MFDAVNKTSNDMELSYSVKDGNEPNSGKKCHLNNIFTSVQIELLLLQDKSAMQASY